MPQGTGLSPFTCSPTHCPPTLSPAGWVIDVPWCAQATPGFSIGSPASRETPQSRMDEDSWSLVLQVAQPGAPGTTRSLERGSGQPGALPCQTLAACTPGPMPTCAQAWEEPWRGK